MDNRSLTLDGASLESRCLDCAETQSATTREHYEQRLVAEARAMVEGICDRTPTVEHLRVVLDWLDGGPPQSSSRDRMQHRLAEGNHLE